MPECYDISIIDWNFLYFTLLWKYQNQWGKPFKVGYWLYKSGFYFYYYYSKLSLIQHWNIHLYWLQWFLQYTKYFLFSITFQKVWEIAQEICTTLFCHRYITKSKQYLEKQKIEYDKLKTFLVAPKFWRLYCKILVGKLKKI